jgi:hypothetical protein
MGNFDDLFDSFLGKNNEDENENNNLHNNEVDDRAKKIIDMINSFKNITANGRYSGDELNKLDSELDDKLGKPDKIVYTQDGDMYIEKRMWFKEHGVIIKRLIKDEPFDNQETEPELTLEEQLSEAVKNEDYELAASLRDQIKKAKAKATGRKEKRPRPHIKPGYSAIEDHYVPFLPPEPPKPDPVPVPKPEPKPAPKPTKKGK